MQENELKRLEQKNPIVEVAVEMGFTVRNNMTACFRTDRHGQGDAPSLFFNIAKNTFLCRTCPDVGGGVTDFICQAKGWPREQAIEWLAHRIEFDRQTREMYYERRGRRR